MESLVSKLSRKNFAFKLFLIFGVMIVVSQRFGVHQTEAAPTRFTFNSWLYYADLVQNRCGGYLELCGSCAEVTENEIAFTHCCNNKHNVRKFCQEYLEYTFEKR